LKRVIQPSADGLATAPSLAPEADGSERARTRRTARMVEGSAATTLHLGDVV
jgi:hypothetical protein